MLSAHRSPKPFSFFKRVQSLVSKKGEELSRPWDPTLTGLVIKTFTETGEFPSVAYCLPASITVFNDMHPFLPILEKAEEHKAELRFEGERVYFSEVRVIRPWAIENSGKSLKEFALKCGIPERFIQVVLSELDIHRPLEALSSALEIKELKRIIVAGAFFSRSKFVVYSEPFSGQTPEWAERLAELMAEASLVTKKVFIAYGIKELPKVWKENALVHFAGESEKGKITLLLNRSKKEDGAFIYTTPQSIYKVRKQSSKETLQSEVIHNPMYAEILQSNRLIHAVKNSVKAMAKPHGQYATSPIRRLKERVWEFFAGS